MANEVLQKRVDELSELFLAAVDRLTDALKRSRAAGYETYLIVIENIRVQKKMGSVKEELMMHHEELSHLFRHGTTQSFYDYIDYTEKKIKDIDEVILLINAIVKCQLEWEEKKNRKFPWGKLILLVIIISLVVFALTR